MFVLGLGLGLVMQVLVLAVQNAVSYADLGVATSSASLFRSMGGSLGTAALGAVFTARLTDELAGTPAAAVSGGGANPAAIQKLPAAIRDTYTGAFSDALSTVFLVGAVILAVAFVLSWLVEERPLRQSVEGAGVGEAFATPSSGDSLRELTRELSRLVGRVAPGVHREHGRRVRRGSGGRGRLGARPGHQGAALDEPETIAKNRPIDATWVREQVADLNEHGLVAHDQLTDRGHAVAEQLIGTAASPSTRSSPTGPGRRPAPQRRDRPDRARAVIRSTRARLDARIILAEPSGLSRAVRSGRERDHAPFGTLSRTACALPGPSRVPAGSSSPCRTASAWNTGPAVGSETSVGCHQAGGSPRAG